MWQPLNNYGGVYEIHPSGLVRRVGKEKPLAITKKGDYYTVHLCKGGKRSKPTLHRLVAMNFKADHYKPGLVVNHRDGNTANNNIDNLEWGTQSYNVKYSFDVLGKRNSRAKYVLNVATGIFYDSIKEAAFTTNYSYQSIRFKLTGKWPNNTSLIII
jgi:hypothetical protein